MTEGKSPFKRAGRDSAKIKLAKKLSQKKYRDELNRFVVENPKTINDAVNGGHQPQTIIASSGFLRQAELDSRRIKADDYLEVDDAVYKSISNLENAPGLMAIYEKPVDGTDQNFSAVYLDGIADPGNVGTIMRSALAFGFKNVICGPTCADPFGPKTVSAAKDSVFKLNIAVDRATRILRRIKKFMPVYAADMKGEKIGSVKKDLPVCVILGSEGAGIDKKVKSFADKTISIPTTGEIESLNVGAAASIIFFYFYES